MFVSVCVYVGGGGFVGGGALAVTMVSLRLCPSNLQQNQHVKEKEIERIIVNCSFLAFPTGLTSGWPS